MTRPRKAAADKTAAHLKCPECGKTFDRPASLGAHRRRAHGIAGASSTRRRARADRRERVDGRRVSTNRRQGRNGVDRDALLGQLFPSGMPARESVLRRVASWLDEAERIARLG